MAARHTNQLTEEMGQVTIPSGIVLVIDTGLLNFWCHDRRPEMPDGALSDNGVASANAAIDFRIEGPDAEQAGRAFDRQWHPRFLFDIPPNGVEAVRNSFAECLLKHGFNARLVPMDRRVSHRERVDAALAYGGAAGAVFFHGISAVAIAHVPADRPLAVVGRRMPADGPDASRWRSVWLECSADRPVRRSELAGDVAVDEARAMFADVEALGQWRHEEPLDGQADFVFWGRDAEKVAFATKAVALGERQWGWVDMPVKEVADRGIEVEHLRDEQGYKIATDFRPHSHHYLIMKQVRATRTESGTIEVGGAAVCAFMTSWGDGFFPVYRDLDDEGRLVRVRIELGNEQIVERQRWFDERYRAK